FEKSFEGPSLVIDELYAKGFIVLNFQLQKIAALTENFSFKSVIIGLENNAEKEAKHII
ncbi:9967_t:CDS:1, partial [Rhizophagus irregularis]